MLISRLCCERLQIRGSPPAEARDITKFWWEVTAAAVHWRPAAKTNAVAMLQVSVALTLASVKEVRSAATR